MSARSVLCRNLNDYRPVKVKELKKMTDQVQKSKRSLSHLPRRPPVNIEFQDLTYTVPQGRKGRQYWSTGKREGNNIRVNSDK